MRRGETGRHEVATAPPLAFEGGLERSLEAAVLAVGRLDGVATLLRDKAVFLYSYVRKEAVLSSQIEGTQSSLSDLLLFELDEAPGVPEGALSDDIMKACREFGAGLPPDSERR